MHGFLLAFALILPLGPQNTFVLTQAATQKRWRCVLPIVITAALSDTALIVLAIGGVSLIVLAIPFLRLVLSAAGVLFLAYMGFKTWTADSRAGEANGSAASWTPARKIRHSLTVSLLNPHAIMDTIVVIGGGAAVYGTMSDRWTYAAAATLVSWVWFFGLSLAGRIVYRAARSDAARRTLDRASAILMWLIAAGYAWQLGRSVVS